MTKSNRGARENLYVQFLNRNYNIAVSPGYERYIQVFVYDTSCSKLTQFHQDPGVQLRFDCKMLPATLDAYKILKSLINFLLIETKFHH